MKFKRIVSAALALSMVACGGSEPAPAPEGGEAAGGTISIGAVLPLTGSSTGEYLKAAMEVAEDIRMDISRNHSATHLLHKALHKLQHYPSNSKSCNPALHMYIRSLPLLQT